MSSFAKTSSLKDNIGVTPIESANTASLWKPSKGFLRPQVFCLQHALEVKEQLQPMGVHICCFYVTQIVGASPRVRQGFYDSDAPRPGPTQVPTLTETNSLQGQSTDTADYLTRGDYVIDSSEDFDIESVDVGDLEVPDVIVSSVATTQIEPPGGVYRPSFEFGSPDRPNVGKGLVYSRESTPRKIFRVDQGIASPPPQSPFVDTAQGSPMVDLTRVVEAGVSAAEAMARSDIEPSPATVPGPSSEVDIQPTAPSATQTPEMHTSPRQRHDRPQSGKNKRKIDF